MSKIFDQHDIRLTSVLSNKLKGSEIIQLAGDIKERIAQGDDIFNYTIGDFDPSLFPIPEGLQEALILAYQNKQTNYPPADGILKLRQALSSFILRKQKLRYEAKSFLISGGARPLIYAAYQAILDKEENAVFPVPSWNNNHYTTLANAHNIAIETFPNTNFMPTAEQLAPHLSNAGLLALCSPLNPTGTVFSKEALKEICDLVLEENRRREGIKKPLYVLYDQIYWQLCHGNTVHYDPVGLIEAMRPYTIYIDGMSKAFAATGVRIGWAFGPSVILSKMKSILGHIGAWAPKPEQVGTEVYLSRFESHDGYLQKMRAALKSRLDAFYELFQDLKKSGAPVDAIQPQAAIYLTVKIDIIGMTLPDDYVFEHTLPSKRIAKLTDATTYLLNTAGVAIVPFTAFGAESESPWYRLSVGTCQLRDIPVFYDRLRSALNELDK